MSRLSLADHRAELGEAIFRYPEHYPVVRPVARVALCNRSHLCATCRPSPLVITIAGTEGVELTDLVAQMYPPKRWPWHMSQGTLGWLSSADIMSALMAGVRGLRRIVHPTVADRSNRVVCVARDLTDDRPIVPRAPRMTLTRAWSEDDV